MSILRWKDIRITGRLCTGMCWEFMIFSRESPAVFRICLWKAAVAAAGVLTPVCFITPRRSGAAIIQMQVERLQMQRELLMVIRFLQWVRYVSIVPNHQTGRVTDLKTRGVVAMAGSFGYELDLGVLDEEEKAIVKQQILDYKKYWDLIQNGDYYRLEAESRDTALEAWMFTAGDQSEALVNVVTLDARCNGPVAFVKLKGLKEDGIYRLEEVVAGRKMAKPEQGMKMLQEI